MFGSTCAAKPNPAAWAIFSPARATAEKIIVMHNPRDMPIVISMRTTSIIVKNGKSIGFGAEIRPKKLKDISMLIIILTWTGIAAAPKKGAAKKNADNLNVCKKKVSRKSNRRCRSIPLNPMISSRLGRYDII